MHGESLALRFDHAFLKKLENHIVAISLHFMYYNFCRIHQTLRVTPAMAAGITDRAWDVEDIVRLLEAEEAEQHEQLLAQRGPVLEYGA